MLPGPLYNPRVEKQAQKGGEARRRGRGRICMHIILTLSSIRTGKKRTMRPTRLKGK
jgi:hypothetical protein